MKFTVFGAKGMIGAAICDEVKRRGYHAVAVGRNTPMPKGPLGHVIYAAGVTGNFLERRADGLDAHVRLVSDVLSHCNFSSFSYLSSTRLYKRARSTNEDTPIPVSSNCLDDYYAITKLMGEALCHGVTHRPARVIRLSNVVGPVLVSGNFLHSIVSEARKTGRVILSSSLASSKDYICLDDAVNAIIMISQGSSQDIYNVAFGENIKHREIASIVGRRFGATIEVSKDAQSEALRPISTERVRSEYGFFPRPVLPLIEKSVESYEEQYS